MSFLCQMAQLDCMFLFQYTSVWVVSQFSWLRQLLAPWPIKGPTNWEPVLPSLLLFSARVSEMLHVVSDFPKPCVKKIFFLRSPESRQGSFEHSQFLSSVLLTGQASPPTEETEGVIQDQGLQGPLGSCSNQRPK